MQAGPPSKRPARARRATAPALVLGLLATGLFPAGLHAQAWEASGARLTLALEIGQAFGPPEHTFGSIQGMALTDDGRLFVLDGMEKEVKAYGPDGAFLHRFGREGAGPGEFLHASRIHISDGEVEVFDSRQFRVSAFTLEGRLLRTERLPSVAELAIDFAAPLRGGLWLATTLPRASLGTPRHDPNFRVVLLDAATGRVDSLASYDGGLPIWHPPGKRAPWGVAGGELGQGGVWAVSGDSLVALVDGYSGRVDILTLGSGGEREARTLSLGSSGRDITRADVAAIERELRELQAAVGATHMPSRVEFILPPMVSAVKRRALFAEDASLWVERNDGASEGHLWTVLEPGGEVRNLLLPEPFRLELVRGRVLYGAWTTDAGAHIVRAFAWTREG